ncbi:MAG: hypothetical protein CMK37_01730 [Porticoccaceae bacterium]|jgi:hypothetical protein|nr:hypothetical protein [Porticoccaceae bacterium]
MVETTNITKQQRGFQYQIWLMLLIVGGVILAGFLMVPKTELQRQQMISIMGTTNLGELVKPTLDFAPLLSGVEVTEKPKWKIVIAGGVGCDNVCQDMLFNSRQVHMLLGKSTRRVERVYLADMTTVDTENLELIKMQHPFLTILPNNIDVFAQIVSENSADWDLQEARYFVVTPDLKAILYYTKEFDGAGLLDDLKHLLKYSPDR